MVTMLSPQDSLIVEEALAHARGKTSAKIDLHIQAVSTSYQIYLFAYGLMLGSLVSLFLWFSGYVENFPGLLCIQIGVILLCGFIHGVSRFFITLIPRRTQQHFAHLAAMRIYHKLHAHRANDEPHVLFFVSLAERYVHVLTNPTVHKQLPENWHDVTDHFTQSVRREGLRMSCVNAINQISHILAAAYPL